MSDKKTIKKEDGETVKSTTRDDGSIRYDKYQDYGNNKHTHEWADTKTGKSGSHGENLSKEERSDHGKSLRH